MWLSMLLAILTNVLDIAVLRQVNPGMDHVILAINDLDAGILQFESLTGVKPVFGGEHPGNNTQNAIVPLSGAQYIEILAPADDLDSVPAFFRDFQELTPIGVALSVDDMNALHRIVQDLGFETAGPQEGSRNTPDESTLSWETLMVSQPNLFINPFFISWSDGTSHPSGVQTAVCQFGRLEMISPHHKQVRKLLSQTNTSMDQLKVREGESDQLLLVINTPRGKVVFE